MDIFSFLCWTAIIIVAIAVFAYYIRKVFRWSENNHSEIITYEVTLVEKKERYALLGASAANGLSNETSPRRYYLYCKTTDGKEIKCEVPYNAFDKVREGRAYLLTMQGSRFIKIERAEEAEANG